MHQNLANIYPYLVLNRIYEHTKIGQGRLTDNGKNGFGKYNSTTNIKSLIYSHRIIVSDTRKKNDGVAVIASRFSDVVAGQLGK